MVCWSVACSFNSVMMIYKLANRLYIYVDTVIVLKNNILMLLTYVVLLYCNTKTLITTASSYTKYGCYDTISQNYGEKCAYY